MQIIMIDYENYNGNLHCFAAHRVTRLSKDGDYTKIHLDTGEILESRDSIKTLSARIEIKTENTE